MANTVTIASNQGTDRKNAGNEFEKKTCRDSQGRLYWPRIYLMDENNKAKVVSAIYCKEEIDYLSEAETVEYNSVSGTPAQLPPENKKSGFWYWAG
jgi:hypothetical protein